MTGFGGFFVVLFFFGVFFLFCFGVCFGLVWVFVFCLFVLLINYSVDTLNTEYIRTEGPRSDQPPPSSARH